ncbi:Angiotensin-converting enzyme [Hypsibius exemplaris]|uniref:Angiotensin-converting enzyme n=1 Tax=Hypsibius exemplaris TaxID=2072580 RepID=A0A1W0X5H0_HYPEX|nr:Angiotensin-converting enzyme [Hypsibius exemplaris]
MAWNLFSILGLAVAVSFHLSGIAWSEYIPVDYSPLTSHQLDTTQLTSADYFRSWLTDVFEPVVLQQYQSSTQAEWDFETNITEATSDASLEGAEGAANATRISAQIAGKFDLSNSQDVQMQRVWRSLKVVGDAALDPVEFDELNRLITNMSTIYSTATVCFDPTASVLQWSSSNPTDCSAQQQKPINPDLQDFMANSTWEADKRRYVWEAWREVSGKQVRKNYIRYVELKNNAAKLNGYADDGELWRSDYTDDSTGYHDSDFLKDLDDLWLQIKPLYDQVHAYVRRILIQKFPEEYISPTGPIPAHLLGDMWSLTWIDMLSFTQLFPSKPLLDVTAEMKAQNYTVDRMFRLSEQFQIDLGLIPMPPEFWEKSQFVKPTDGRDVFCSANAWDFYRPGGVRIKMCATVSMSDLLTVHHEMGHVQYFLQYASQLVPFRSGANAGFHEAVGDTFALSIGTPSHLAYLGLLKNITNDRESDLNYQFATALDKLVFLPFAYIMDRYRYDVFSGKIGTDRLNQGWWDYASKYQGIAPPTPRGEEFFDPGAKYHIDADVEYMRYFIDYVIQFQFYKALCDAAGHAGPLYQCDINKSKKAGTLLSSMLSLGSSQPWPIALEKITGSRRMSAAPLLDFFQPLIEYLKTVNQHNDDVIDGTGVTPCLSIDVTGKSGRRAIPTTYLLKRMHYAGAVLDSPNQLMNVVPDFTGLNGFD